MTCEVCDREGCQRDRFADPWDAATMAEVVDCEAHAVIWRDLAIAGRAREAALTAEVERLRAERANIDHVAVEADRFVDALMGAWAEATPDSADAMDVARRAMRSHLVRLHDDLATARADAANARRIATEAIEIADSLVTIAKRGYVLRGRVANLATLRARLASPEPAKET